MSHRKTARFSIVAMGLLAALLMWACRGRNVATVGTAPTPTPTPSIDRTQLAPDTSQNPFRQYAPGLLARTVYKAEDSGRFAVEIWELLVGPGKKSEAATLPGGAIFEIRSGDALVQVAGKPREAKTGNTFSIDDGEAFQIENRSAEEAVSIRVVVIRGQ